LLSCVGQDVLPQGGDGRRTVHRGSLDFLRRAQHWVGRSRWIEFVEAQRTGMDRGMKISGTIRLREQISDDQSRGSPDLRGVAGGADPGRAGRPEDDALVGEIAESKVFDLDRIRRWRSHFLARQHVTNCLPELRWRYLSVGRPDDGPLQSFVPKYRAEKCLNPRGVHREMSARAEQIPKALPGLNRVWGCSRTPSLR
jgi:hypothetical protein